MFLASYFKINSFIKMIAFAGFLLFTLKNETIERQRKNIQRRALLKWIVIRRERKLVYQRWCVDGYCALTLWQTSIGKDDLCFNVKLLKLDLQFTNVSDKTLPQNHQILV